MVNQDTEILSTNGPNGNCSVVVAIFKSFTYLENMTFINLFKLFNEVQKEWKINHILKGSSGFKHGKDQCFNQKNCQIKY